MKRSKPVSATSVGSSIVVSTCTRGRGRRLQSKVSSSQSRLGARGGLSAQQYVVRSRRPDGQLDQLLGNVPSPNGVVLSPDERVLFVGMTRANQVWRVPVQADGSVSKVGAFFTSHGPSGPDGLAMDTQGRLIVANPGLGCAWVLNPRAEPLMVVRSPVVSSLTNVAFVGVDDKTLYCTESSTGSVLRVTLDVAGLPLARPA
jgi:gluconolactonase